MTENSQYDLKPESETPQESSTKKKDASHQGMHVDDDETKSHNSTDNSDRIEPSASAGGSALRNVTKKPEVEESAKKTHKHHPPSKESKLGAEETLILGVATDDVAPTHLTRAPSKTATSSSSQAKVTKSSMSEDKATKTDKTTVSKTTTKTFTTSTLNIETSSSVHVIESTPTVVLRPTAVVTDSTSDSKSSVVSLEPSRVSDIEYTSPASSVSTPTDGLPTSYSKSSTMIEKSTVRPATATFTKNAGM